MNSMIWKILAAGSLVSLAACGGGSEGGTEPEVSADPIGEVRGVVLGSTGGAQLVNPSVGLVWARYDEVGEEPVLSIEVAPFAGDASSFTLPVFSVPPSSALQHLDLDDDGTIDVSFAFGGVIAFEDVDADGAVSLTEMGVGAPDRIFGLTLNNGLLYLDPASDPASAEEIFGAGVAVGTMQLVQFETCNAAFAFLPVSTPVDLWTFTPGTEVSEEELPEDALACDGGVCGADLESAECNACLDGAIRVCEAGCATEGAAVEACVTSSGCTELDDEACLESACGTEIDAFFACFEGCSEVDACFE